MANTVSVHVSIRRAYKKRGRTNLIREAASAALAQANLVGNAELIVRLTDDDELHRLNRAFRNSDKTTDVLSFGGEDFFDGELKRSTHNPTHHLGEIYISMNRCEAQAHEEGHRVDDELCLLVVHGALHLVGYDHMNAKRKRAMWSAQDRAFDMLGVRNPLGKS
jgi:probable rRNA maturation factor